MNGWRETKKGSMRGRAWGLPERELGGQQNSCNRKAGMITWHGGEGPRAGEKGPSGAGLEGGKEELMGREI